MAGEKSATLFIGCTGAADVVNCAASVAVYLKARRTRREGRQRRGEEGDARTHDAMMIMNPKAFSAAAKRPPAVRASNVSGLDGPIDAAYKARPNRFL